MLGLHFVETFGNKCCVFKLSTAKEFHIHNLFGGLIWEFLGVLWGVFCLLVCLGFH